MDYADRSGDEFQRLARRSDLGNALTQAGRTVEGLERFREAETMQAQDQPNYPLLYSARGRGGGGGEPGLNTSGRSSVR